MSAGDRQIRSAMKSGGYIKSVKMTDTLQGSVWRAIQKSTNKEVVIKVTDRYLHKNRIIIADARKIRVYENIKKETLILKQLSSDPQCPNTIAQYIDAFKSKSYYFLVMEDGGCSLFEFVLKAHRLIEKGIIDISEWHKMVKIILKQMIECIEYIHSKNVFHFDISLENFLINYVEVEMVSHKMQFCTDSADSVCIKLCDFGLAEAFGKYSNFKSNKFCGKTKYESPEIRNKKTFSAKSNDIWCLGVSFFMMIIGNSPWNVAQRSDKRFIHIMCGDIVGVLKAWNRLCYINDNIVDIFRCFFQFENKRVALDELKECEWLCK